MGDNYGMSDQPRSEYPMFSIGRLGMFLLKAQSALSGPCGVSMVVLLV